MVPDKALLHGKVAVVTGGSRGIGRAAAIQLARAGANVVVSARNHADLLETVSLIQAQNRTGQAIVADVSEWLSVQSLADQINDEVGPVDILVVNAGIIEPIGDAWTLDPLKWQRNIEVNLTGSYYTARAFLPRMVARQSGMLIFVSSGVVRHPRPGWSAYTSAKAGLEHFALTLAAELDEAGLPIRVHVFHPGVVDTRMQAEIRQVPEEQFHQVENYRKLKQRGQLRPPEQPGMLIRWLATPMAADTHGVVISLDDRVIRQRLAHDLQIEPFPDR